VREVVALVKPPISFIFNMKIDCRSKVKELTHLSDRLVHLVDIRDEEGRHMVGKEALPVDDGFKVDLIASKHKFSLRFDELISLIDIKQVIITSLREPSHFTSVPFS